MENPEKLATYVTQDEDKINKYTILRFVCYPIMGLFVLRFV
jgi:hypothetical protein